MNFSRTPGDRDATPNDGLRVGWFGTCALYSKSGGRLSRNAEMPSA